MIRLKTLILVVVLGGTVSACQQRFEFALYPTTEGIFKAALIELNEGRSRAAATAFERLTSQLPTRDTLLPRAYWYLGVAQMNNKEWVLAGNAFRQIHAQFSTDTLADDGLLAAAKASRRMWRNPELYAEYGEDARGLLTKLLSVYPQSPLREEVFKELDDLAEAFATKDYEVAKGYYRRKGYGPAIIYLEDALDLYSATRKAREIRILMVKSYLKLKYADQAEDQCKVLREMYRGDKEVLELCGAAPPPTSVPS